MINRERNFPMILRIYSIKNLGYFAKNIKIDLRINIKNIMINSI